MESKQPLPTEPPKDYPVYPDQGYAVPGYPGTQVQVGIPQHASGLPQYRSPSTLPDGSVISGFETCNKYEIKNPTGQWVYFAAEENNDYNLYRYGSFRSFTIKFFDSTNQPVMQVSREYHCVCCCCPCICCLQKLEVQAPLGTVIGFVKQNCYVCQPRFDIQNEAGENILKLLGPNSLCHGYRDIHFEIKSLNPKSTIGKITRKWKGLAAEVASDASNFIMQFPMDLEVKTKTLLLGACFLLDFLFFERTRPRRRNQT